MSSLASSTDFGVATPKGMPSMFSCTPAVQEQVMVARVAFVSPFQGAARAICKAGALIKDFNPSKMVEMGRRLEELERPAAKERQGTRTDLQPSGDSPGSSTKAKGDTRDKVASALGVGGKKYEHAKNEAKDRQREAGKKHGRGIAPAESAEPISKGEARDKSDSKTSANSKSKSARRAERERLKSIQFPRPGVVRGKDIWDLSTIRTTRRWGR